MDFDPAAPQAHALKPDLVAPGEDVKTVGAQGVLRRESGTSLSEPHAAGSAALVWEARPDRGPGEVKQLLLATADSRCNGGAHHPSFAPWATAFGWGILNVGAAVNTTAMGDVRFPNCVAPSATAGRPCALPPPRPWYGNDLDIRFASPPRHGVKNTISADITNDGTSAATVWVTFGVYEFAGVDKLRDLGAHVVFLAAGGSATVAQPWTPLDGTHQCIRVEIQNGMDGADWNNVTQRNVEVSPVVNRLRVMNPFLVPATFSVGARSLTSNAACFADIDDFALHPFFDCGQEVTIGARSVLAGAVAVAAECEVTLRALPEGAETPVDLGGVVLSVPASNR